MFLKQISNQCFVHDTLHGSADVIDTKYVLRTEMMFSRLNTTEISSSKDYLDLPNYHRLVSVYSSSQTAFQRGDIEAFTANYQVERKYFIVGLK